MQRLAASFVLGYHGCDSAVAEALTAGDPFRFSRNDYDWLGDGVYFWEANPVRGLAFAERASHRPSSGISRPSVVGAIIDLGVCLDLTTTQGVQFVRRSFESLKAQFEAAGQKLPENQDALRRQLDRAVVNHVHTIMATSGSPPIDSLRGVFTEGKPIFPGSGFDEETHIQIAIRNLDCIKGVFRVPAAHLVSR